MDDSKLPSTRLNSVQMLLERLGGENGMLGGLVKRLNLLLEDPLLRQTLDSQPDDANKLN